MRTTNDLSLEDHFELKKQDQKILADPNAKRYDKLLAQARLKHGYQPYSSGDESILQDYDEIYNNLCFIDPPMNEHERHIFAESSSWGREEYKIYRQFKDADSELSPSIYVHVYTDSITGSPVVTFIPRSENGDVYEQINADHDDLYVLCSQENFPRVVFWVNANVLKHADCPQCKEAPTYYSAGVELAIPELSPIHFETFHLNN